MNKKCLATEKSPGAIGPYSQGISANGFIYTSGQLPLNVEDGVLITDIKKATAQCIENCNHILNAGGSDLSKVVKVVVYLKNMDNFKDMNEVYGKYLGENSPARSCFEVAKLPMDAMVEIEMVAMA